MNKDSPQSEPAARLDAPRGAADTAITAARRAAVTAVVQHTAVGSQAVLLALLKARGFAITQATLSRDLKAQRIGKVPTGDGGYVYTLPAQSRLQAGPGQPHWQLAAFVQEVRMVGNLVLLRTTPGSASGAARVLDQLGWDQVQGTLSGNDTVLVVTSSEAHAGQFRTLLASLTGRRL